MQAPHQLIQQGLLGEAVDDGPVGILVADDDMRYIVVNRYACELLGYTRDELLGLRLEEVHGAEGTEREFDEFRIGNLREGTAPMRKKDGDLVQTAYRGSETKVAGMTFYVAVFWPI